MSSYEPIPGYAQLVSQFRNANDSKHCTWNITVTIWEVRGMQTYNGSGTNNLSVTVMHEGISNASRVFESSISNVLVNHVYKRTFHGQSGDFFMSSINVVASTGKLLGPKFIGQVKIGVMDVFLSKGHLLPMQWFAFVDPLSDLPVEPLGFVKMNIMITTLGDTMAVQNLSPDAIGDWELRREPPMILQIPRLNLRKCACHQYNIKFYFYQGYALGASQGLGSCDPRVRVVSACGQFQTDPEQNTTSPVWNTLLQCPFYEPNYMDLIQVEVHDAGARASQPGGVSKLSAMTFSWKHIMCNLKHYENPRWIDMYELPPNLMADTSIPFTDGMSPEQAIGNLTGISLGYPGYVEKCLYGGRLLMSVEVEPRTFEKEPSPANIALKPKDCEDKWSDAKQKCLFRFQAFYGQGLRVDGIHGSVRLEFSVGAAKCYTKPKPKGDNTLFEWYEAMEMECEFPFDDFRDNPNGKAGKLSEGKGAWNPDWFLENLPDTVIKVYRIDASTFSNQLIGYWKGPTRQMLVGVGDPFADWKDVVYVGSLEDENGTGGIMSGIQPIMIAPGDSAPLPRFPKQPFGDPDDPVSTRDCL